MSSDMPIRQQMIVGGRRGGKMAAFLATVGASTPTSPPIVRPERRPAVRVPVSTKTGTEYTYDISTGQLRRRFPKPDRHKKVRRRLRDQARALAALDAHRATRGDR